MKSHPFKSGSIAVSVAASTVALAVSAALAAPASAVVIFNPDGAAPANDTPPPADPGWFRTGRVGNTGSGVHLGGGWILSANHVTSFSPLFRDVNGLAHPIVPGTRTRLQDPTLSYDVDLVLFQVAVPAASALSGQGNLPIASSSPTLGGAAVMVGTGRIQDAATPTPFFVDVDTDPLTWSATDSPEADFEAQVIPWSNTRGQRWATASIDELAILDDTFGDSEGDDLIMFATVPDGSATGGNVAEFDSGSPLFIDDGSGSVQLAGIAHLVQTFSGQPAETFAAFVDGESLVANRSLYSDLAAYAPQINAIVPEPASAAMLLAVGTIAVRRRRA